MSTPFRAVIVSGVHLYGHGLAHQLSRFPQLAVAGVAFESAEACECVRRVRPQVVLLDASFPSFLTLVPTLREAGAAHIVAFAVGEFEADALLCAQAGVSAFVDRTASIEDLVNTVNASARGELWMSPRLVAMLFRRVGLLSRTHAAPGTVNLTAREAEILALLQQGLSNKEIASQLRLRLSTVKNHVHRLLEKLGVHRRAEAVALARRRA